MDDWFLQNDVIDQLSKYHEDNKSLVTVFRKSESSIQRDFHTLLHVKQDDYTSSLESYEFDELFQKSDHSIVRKRPNHWGFSLRIANLLYSFTKTSPHRNGWYSDSEGDLATNKDHFESGEMVSELKLRKDFLLQDLKRTKRKGVFCFEISRYSEKTLEELGFLQSEEVQKSEHYIWKRTLRGNGFFRFRMKSVSIVIGKVLVR